MLFLYLTKYDPGSETGLRMNIKCEGIWHMRLRTTGYQKRDWLANLKKDWLKSNVLNYLSMRLVNEKQKRVSELEGISATSLREKETNTNVTEMSLGAISSYACSAWHWLSLSLMLLCCTDIRKSHVYRPRYMPFFVTLHCLRATLGADLIWSCKSYWRIGIFMRSINRYYVPGKLL